MRILELLEDFIAQKWRGVKHKRGRKFDSITTNDLDADGKLTPGFLKIRKLRNKERNKSKPYGFTDYD
ncbi:hypothetical protein ES702_06735 [subsurface metagenome]